MISRQIGRFFGFFRDQAARGLLRIGVRPNMLTVLGMMLTVGAGVATAAGRAYWGPWAVSLLVAAGACDLLDGAIAKIGRLESRFGAILDSVCDRTGDAALYLGPAVYFALASEGPDGVRLPTGQAGPNLTLLVLAGAGLVWAYLTSYIKARAESEGAEGGGGFWQRPERFVTILLALAFQHLATAVWILGVWPLATVAHRLWRARLSSAALAGATAGQGGPVEPRGLWAIVLWRWPRGSLPFDIHAGAVILMVIFWDVPAVDPLRDLAAWWVGA
jgi:CDP-diacylglycerol--glycerol-3-phosphate 3-phosphatidyltransferase